MRRYLQLFERLRSLVPVPVVALKLLRGEYLGPSGGISNSALFYCKVSSKLIVYLL